MAFFKFRKGFDSKTVEAPSPQESIETMRRRAKHRLLGTTVLVLVAVIGFPVLFDSQPRPVSVDISIVMPDKDKVKPLAIPGMATLPAVSTAVPGASASAAAKSAPAAPPKDTIAPAASIGAKEEIVTDKAAAKTPVQTPLPAVPATATAPAAPRADDGAKAKALLEGKVPAPPATGELRFVVQVGAFADAEKASEVRQKLERAGLKTYAQVVDTKDGKRTRVRVGPFADKSQAEQTAEKVKTLDLPVVVLAL